METGTEVAVVPEVRYDLSMARAPQQVLAEATGAAKALSSVVNQSKSVVKFNGKTYLAFEHWQVLGRFYGVTARIVNTEAVDMDGVKGFLARAEAVNTQTGQVVSSAESMCMNDEQNWAKKPLFQLRSMAQTRAAAKSLRNVLAWVVVLAGYEPSVAEEMTGEEHDTPAPIAPPKPKSDTNVMTFVPEAYSAKELPSGSTKHGVKYKGEWYGVFEESDGEKMKSAYEGKTPITITWELDKTGKYRNIVKLTA